MQHTCCSGLCTLNELTPKLKTTSQRALNVPGYIGISFQLLS